MDRKIKMHNVPHTKESKIKMSLAHKGQHISPETEFKKGHIVSQEMRDKTGKRMENTKKTKKWRKNLSEAHKGMKKPWSRPPHYLGEKSSHYKGGISPQYKSKNAPRPKPNQCEVCGAFGSDTKKGLCFDHDHKTGKFRGWICGRCNLALGMVKENTETLVALIEYIKKNKTEEIKK